MESGKLLRQDIDYRKMMVWRFFLSLWSMSIPFYTIFAIKKLGFSEMNIGFLFASQTAGLVLMSLIWGYISDRKSNRVVLIYNSVIAIIVPLLPLFSFYFQSHSTMLISIAFFMMGSLLGGTWIGYLNYIIDLSPKEKVSTYVGFMNTFTGITFVLVPLGGLLADLFNLQTIFYISGASGILMVVFSLLLRETRDNEGG
jgi:MFS family permease